MDCNTWIVVGYSRGGMIRDSFKNLGVDRDVGDVLKNSNDGCRFD